MPYELRETAWTSNNDQYRANDEYTEDIVRAKLDGLLGVCAWAGDIQTAIRNAADEYEQGTGPFQAQRQ